MRYEAISKYNIMGIEFVKLEDLNELIGEMQRKTRDGKEPGYMCDDKGQRIAADLALNHLRAVLNREKNFDGMLMRLYKTRIEREAKEQGKEEMPAGKGATNKRIPGRYTVWHYGDDDETTHDSFGFVRFEAGIPMFSNRPCAAMRFVERGMARKVAEKLGEGFTVVDMWNTMTEEERLLRALFADAEMDEDGEWHGDGTRAEDENWDDE